MIKEYSQTFTLAAVESNAQGMMPLTLVIDRCILLATLHANALGIGYAGLIERGWGWVLSRINVEVLRYPEINEQYTVTTWIEGFNRMYSDRVFLFTDADGNPIAHGRSMWVAIDMRLRTAVDLSALNPESFPLGTGQCPLPKIPKLPPLKDPDSSAAYTFQYADIDFNRHVNTVQYVRLLLNQWPLEHYDSHSIRSFNIAFQHECHFGEEVSLLRRGTDSARIDIVRPDGMRAIAAEITFTPTPQP